MFSLLRKIFEQKNTQNAPSSPQNPNSSEASTPILNRVKNSPSYKPTSPSFRLSQASRGKKKPLNTPHHRLETQTRLKPRPRSPTELKHVSPRNPNRTTTTKKHTKNNISLDSSKVVPQSGQYSRSLPCRPRPPPPRPRRLKQRQCNTWTGSSIIFPHSTLATVARRRYASS